MKNKKYFELGHKHVTDVDVLKTCYEYFINLEGLAEFHKKPAPKTQYQKDMQSASVPMLDRWLISFVMSQSDRKIINTSSKSLFDLFQEWICENTITYAINAISFGLKLKRLNLKGLVLGKKNNKGNTYLINIPLLIDELGISDDVDWECYEE